MRKSRCVIATAVSFVATSSMAAGDIAFTSFEEPPVFPNVQYVDTGNASEDHQLFNNVDEPFVEYASVGGEMGYTAWYINSRNDVGLTDGDFVGVNDFVGTVGAYTDGLQGYQLTDADGTMRVIFDEVDLSGASTPFLIMDYFVQETGWEANDRVHIWLETDLGTIEVINTEGSDIDDLGIEGFWNNAKVDLTGATTATLYVELECNSGSEGLYIDFIRFTEVENNEVTICPELFIRRRGLNFGGTIDSLCESDDDYLRTRPDVLAAALVPPVQIEIIGTSPNTDPTELRFTFEAASNTTPVLQRILLFNFDTSAYELVDQRVVPLTDNVVILVVTDNPGKYINDSTGQMKTLATYTQVGTFPPTWEIRIDQGRWTVVN